MTQQQASGATQPRVWRKVTKPADEPGHCPVCQTTQTTMPRRTSDGYVSVWCFGCQYWRRIGC